MAQVLDLPHFANPNDQRIFEVMTDLICADRSMLCGRTGLKRTTVYDACRRLILQGILHKEEQKITPGNGRPSTIYIIDPKFQHMTTAAWRRVVDTLLDVFRFFHALKPKQEIFCRQLGGMVRYQDVQNRCVSKCGTRIKCPKDQDGVKK